jgi:hypothetical protein
VFGHLGTNATVVPSAGLSLIFWPHTWNGRVGVGIEGRAGLDRYTKGALSSRTDVSAALSESVAAVSARARFGDGRLFLELAAGPSLHILGLSYSVVSAGSPMAGTVTRVDPAFEVAAFPEVSIGDRVRVGALIGSSLLPVHQRFIAAGETVLRIDAAAYDFGGRVSFVLD